MSDLTQTDLAPYMAAVDDFVQQLIRESGVSPVTEEMWRQYVASEKLRHEGDLSALRAAAATHIEQFGEAWENALRVATQQP